MKTIICILVFVAMGAAGGVLLNRRYQHSSLLLNVLLGIVGSMGLSKVVFSFGLGSGFLAFSVWGIVFGVLGALLLPFLYCLIQNRSQTKASQSQS